MKSRILLVDDSSLARRTMRQHLEALGYEVDDAPDGPSGIERFFLSPPDLVILDMVMTGMYGLEVLAKMLELNPDVKVLVATADIQSSTSEQVRAAGAKGILNKPLQREKLQTAVETVLSGGATWN